ncbi:tyrosine-type recombinase/integrase [Streptosporangium sp. NPDC001559]|uniref:tyrosine-type recombinase/integrase n=1 Tax=Streptosporangium sp. NPDC001559 TaxID=3366187 RepID=UPI0036EC6120
MAFAEKRGKYWRSRFKTADGSLGSASCGYDGRRFTTEKAAVDFGEEQEADVRRNLWRDPRSGDILLQDWVNQWYPAQDLELTTLDGYRWHIEVHILPYFGHRPLNTLTAIEINAWELQLHREKICGETSAASARTLLHTILSDAVAAGLIAANPAVRRRNRGRKNGKSRTRGPEREWSTPLTVLLLGERLAALSGRPDDFVQAVTVGYTGLRWAETVGLERQYFRLSSIRVEQQVYERGGTWIKKAPKDDSYRTIPIPTFLTDLLSEHLKASGNGKCGCKGPRGCGGGQYVFLGEDGGHERRSNYGQRRFRLAADGRHPGMKSRPGYPVLVDLAETPWPGLVKRSWPMAVEGQEFSPPHHRGFWRYDIEQHHVASWLPLMKGLTPQGLRHGHKVWLDEDGIPTVASEERLGHELPGIVGTYSHTSEEMVRRILEGLQKRWEASLRERATVWGGRSSVPVLDGLLAPYRQAAKGRIQDLLPPRSQEAVTDLRARPKKRA